MIEDYIREEGGRGGWYRCGVDVDLGRRKADIERGAEGKRGKGKVSDDGEVEVVR